MQNILFFQDWCQQRQLMMLVIAVNVSLATMFFNLLSQWNIMDSKVFLSLAESHPVDSSIHDAPGLFGQSSTGSTGLHCNCWQITTSTCRRQFLLWPFDSSQDFWPQTSIGFPPKDCQPSKSQSHLFWRWLLRGQKAGLRGRYVITCCLRPNPDPKIWLLQFLPLLLLIFFLSE